LGYPHRLGAHPGDYDLEEMGLAVPESGSASTARSRAATPPNASAMIFAASTTLLRVGRPFPIQKLTA